MKRIYSLLALAGVLAAPNVFAAFDGTIHVNSDSTYRNTTVGGGEFNVTGLTGPVLGTFQTFCLESGENIDVPGGPYDYNVNTGAVQGGPGAGATDSHTGLPMDNISIATAYLFSQFSAGTLSGYAAANPQRILDAGSLQQAIWFLEGEAGGVRNGFVDTAETQLGILLNGGVKLTDTQAEADAGANNFNVVALNLFNGADAKAVTIGGVTYNLNQDILAVVPEPTTMIAGALLLLPFGASTLRVLRKNKQG